MKKLLVHYVYEDSQSSISISPLLKDARVKYFSDVTADHQNILKSLLKKRIQLIKPSPSLHSNCR